MPEIPQKEEDRKKINRSYDIFVDQNDWLVNSPLNKSKFIRDLLDNAINEIDATIIQNLQDEIENYIQIKIRRIKEHEDQIRELMQTIESQKSVIVALGGKE